MNFHERLTKLLEEEGVTKKQVSEGTGISLYRINSWLKGTRTPNGKHILILSCFFDVSTDFLLGRVDENGKAH